VGNVAENPVRASMIVITRYVPEATWAPDRRTPGVGALAMLANAVPARARSEEATRAIGRAAAETVVLEGDRGDAGETAVALMRIVASLG
jgi:hypothetical protein